ncbi:molybdopterin molybdotransferase MoeA [Methanoculleus bourgensis]|uniref:molybdopterin molybdotransferase MoeA n=1 Tax=Methanoculleus bourgensis TaxID=83986 RepID=UPI0022ED95CC|nr:gephyrin-like molybdotransferase Glp [Methanoculleus bourgensis]GLI47500.1 molybdopterin molybdenumtransferase MoeA [Methanoculleus bourgensis]
MTGFLRLISVIEAIHIINRISPAVGTEYVPLTAAYGRVLAEDVQADTDIPGFDRSVKDGFAVNSADTVRASEAAPVPLTRVGRVAMGRGGNGLAIRPGECAYIPTGGALPKGADAVVMLEYCQDLGETVLAGRQVSPDENIIRADEDYARGEGVLAAGKLLKVQDIGVLAAVGVSRVAVRKRPVIGIVPTGVELVPPDQVPAAGEVRDVNSYLCGAFVEEMGGVPRYYDIVRDDRAELAALLSSALDECDAFLITGGSSKDDRDITADVIGSLGEVLAHGMALAPGKPTIIGKIGHAPVIGIPGHPASTRVVLAVLAAPLLQSLSGCTGRREAKQKAVLTRNIPSERGREEYVRVKLLGDEAVPLFGKSGLLNTLVESDGLIRILQGCEGLEAGSEVDVTLW